MDPQLVAFRHVSLSQLGGSSLSSLYGVAQLLIQSNATTRNTRNIYMVDFENYNARLVQVIIQMNGIVQVGRTLAGARYVTIHEWK
jgi:hypothetical protein